MTACTFSLEECHLVVVAASQEGVVVWEVAADERKVGPGDDGVWLGLVFAFLHPLHHEMVVVHRSYDFVGCWGPPDVIHPAFQVLHRY